ncbi:hypothetical protein ACIQTN_29795 [Streptomyces werraensis]|uniref:hypothetical protein n=1 Tax=Streptomyces werraensis TaxID=68284 RepID=UPI00381702F0
MHTRDRLRVFYLFGRPYWWHTTPRGQLTLMPATWRTHKPPTTTEEETARDRH